jgi:predicted DNA-binding transcriptional regulator AlpA
MTRYPQALPETGFMRLPQILKVFPIGKSTWWAKVKAGKYPKPVKLGPRTTAWRVEDICDLMEEVLQASGSQPAEE